MKCLSKYIVFKGKDIVQTLTKVNETSQNCMPALIGGFGKIYMNTIKRYFSTESNVKTESKLRSKIGPYLAGFPSPSKENLSLVV